MNKFRAVELATLVDVPILRAGKHVSHNAGEIEITEEELDDILEGSTALIPLVKESLETGVYRGNESLKLAKMPGFINLVHDDLLRDTIKERTKGVNVEYSKKYFQDPATGEQVPWMTQTFRDVPTDIAEAIKTRFPKRSVELIPFKDPATGKSYRMAVRSTAFLNNEWRETPPAVKGQDANLQIAFSQGESPVLVLFSGDPKTVNTNTQQQEVTVMADTKTPENGGIVTELQAKLKEQADELQSYKELHEAERAEREALDKKVVEMQAREAERDVVEFMKDLRGKNITGADGVVYAPSKAFCDVVEPLIARTSTSAVIEMAEGTKPARSVLMSAVTEIVELAGKDGGMLVAMGQLAPGVAAPPDEDKPKSATELMAEYEKEGLSPSEAWKKANAHNYGGK